MRRALSNCEPGKREVAALHFDQPQVGERFDEPRVVFERQGEPRLGCFEIARCERGGSRAIELDRLGSQRGGAGARPSERRHHQEQGKDRVQALHPFGRGPRQLLKNVQLAVSTHPARIATARGSTDASVGEQITNSRDAVHGARKLVHLLPDGGSTPDRRVAPRL